MSKKIIIAVAMVAVISLLGLKGWLSAENQTQQINGPIIKVTPLQYNLGTVIYGDIASTTLTVKNTGNEPLLIQKLSTSCGCTKAFMNEEDKTITPGQEAKITITFDPATHKDDTDIGEIVRVVYIKSNDQKTPEVQVQLNAAVIKK